MRGILSVLFSVVLLNFGGMIKHLIGEDTGSGAVSIPSKPKLSRPVPANGFRDEAHWVVSTVVSEMLRWGPSSDVKVLPVDDECTSYRAIIGERTVDFKIDQYLWSSEDYLRMAEAIAIPGQKKPDNDQALLTSLLTPTTSVLLESDKTLSARLHAAPLDPILHEQAALLCAVMAFREVAGRFNDPRREFCSTTAHLALALAGRKQLGPAAQIASALLSAMNGREKDALSAVSTWPKDGMMASWAKVIRLRAVADWKTDVIAENAPLIEQMAYCRAMAERRDQGPTVTWLTATKRTAIPDWGRILCETWLSVENGHVYAHQGLMEEIPEIITVCRHFTGKKESDLKEDDILATLKMADQGPRRILGASRWSSFLERHFCHRIVAAYVFCNEMWAEPQATAEILGLCTKQFASLRLMPLVRLQFQTDPQRLLMAKAGAEMVRKDPALINPWLWRYLVTTKELDAIKTQIPAAEQWWVTVSPPGTAYYAPVRSELLGNGKSIAHQLEEAAILDPHDSRLRIAIAHKAGNIDIAKLSKEWADLLDQDIFLVRLLASHAKTPAERVITSTPLAALDPNGWMTLGEALCAAGRNEEAVTAFENAFEKATDRVSVANRMGWLITWYADHNKMARAKEIAAHGYEVFSYSGIASKAKLDERCGDLDAAEKAFADIESRYDDDSPLLAFWQRTAKVRPASKQAFDARIKKLFPSGIQPGPLASFKGPPRSGVRVSRASNIGNAHGVRLGYIIVSIDGQRCETEKQYLFIRELKTGVPLDLILWNGSIYQQLTIDVPDRRLGVGLEDWTSK